MNGLLVLDKPRGMTSRDAVNRVQRWLPRGTRIGHTGTLDPLATGVLVLCVGPATRLTEYVQDLPKTYRSRFLLGARSDTDDADGTITPVADAVPPTPEAIRAGLDGFLGEIEQVPPAYSAAKVTGRRAYDLARRGEEVALAPRRVRIDGIGVLGYEYPNLDVEVRCGKGTYIRSLARDLGERLGCGALVAELRRTRVGPFRAEDALPLESDPPAARSRLLPPAQAVAHLPPVRLDAPAAGRLRNGQAVAAEAAGLAVGSEVAVLDAGGELVGVAVVAEGGRLRPAKVLGG